MLFVEYDGPAEVFTAARDAVRERVASVLRIAPRDVIVRRWLYEGDYAGVEVWVELSSEEQRYRYAQRLAEEITAALRPHTPEDIWVLFRIVPLDQAYLNGVPRRRDSMSLDD